MKFTPTAIRDVLLIEPKVFEDPRGFFMETYRRDVFAAQGINADFVQINHSQSVRHALRGLHYQVGHPQGKLVRVLRGEVFDVVVDIRFGSPTFGHWISEVLSARNKKQLFVPIGFAHGFCVLSDEAEFLYYCTDYYHPQGEKGIIWNDPDLAIPWPTPEPLLSEKDRRNPRFRDIERDFTYRPQKTVGRGLWAGSGKTDAGCQTPDDGEHKSQRSEISNRKSKISNSAN